MTASEAACSDDDLEALVWLMGRLLAHFMGAVRWMREAKGERGGQREILG